MQESKGKKAARLLFYLELLPEWLSQAQLVSGDFLVLLGKEPRELPLLDALSVPRNHIWSVERNNEVYMSQLDQQLRVSLHYGEMAEYLQYLFNKNQAFMVLNLDVEGSYLSQLEPAMTSVLLFCWNNPETVIATYSSIGRDTETLWEGVRSLAVFLALLPKETKQALSALCLYYQQMGFNDPIRMALRDLLWIRSHLEHAAVTSFQKKMADRQDVRALQNFEDVVWQTLVSSTPLPLVLESVEAAVSQIQAKPPHQLRFGIQVADMRHVIYRAEPPWIQRCYFSKLDTTRTPVTIKEWLRDTLEWFVRSTFTYIDNQGVRNDIRLSQAEPLGADTVVWEREDLYNRFLPRKIRMV